MSFTTNMIESMSSDNESLRGRVITLRSLNEQYDVIVVITNKNVNIQGDIS